MLEDLTGLVGHVETSSNSLEATIATTLGRQSTGMNQLKHDLQSAHSQHTTELAAKFEAMVVLLEETVRLRNTVRTKTIQGLQIYLISKPSLMQSVCQENSRLGNLSRSDSTHRDGALRLRNGRIKKKTSKMHLQAKAQKFSFWVGAEP